MLNGNCLVLDCFGPNLEPSNRNTAACPSVRVCLSQMGEPMRTNENMLILLIFTASMQNKDTPKIPSKIVMEIHDCSNGHDLQSWRRGLLF